MRCVHCKAEVPDEAFRCPGCGLVQVEGEGLETYKERERELAAIRRQSGGGFQGIESWDIAGPGDRVLAFAIDFVVVVLVSLGVLRIMGTAPGDISGNTTAIATFQATQLIVSVLYWTLFTASRWSGTPGKKLLGMRVVNQYGEPASIGQVFMREIIGRGICQNFPLFYLMILATDRNQGLHDKIAGTFVTDDA